MSLQQSKSDRAVLSNYCYSHFNNLVLHSSRLTDCTSPNKCLTILDWHHCNVLFVTLQAGCWSSANWTVQALTLYPVTKTWCSNSNTTADTMKSMWNSSWLIKYCISVSNRCISQQICHHNSPLITHHLQQAQLSQTNCVTPYVRWNHVNCCNAV